MIEILFMYQLARQSDAGGRSALVVPQPVRATHGRRRSPGSAGFTDGGERDRKL